MKQKELTLAQELANQKKYHLEVVRKIKLKHRFMASSYEQKAKIISSASQEDRQRLWGSLTHEQRIFVSKTLLAKSISVKACSLEGHYMNLGGSKPRLSASHYSVGVYPMKGLYVRIANDLNYKPSEADILRHVKQYFPSVTLIH